MTLNELGQAIWELCDGSHTLDDMVHVLRARFQVDRVDLSGLIGQTLDEMSRAGFVDHLPTRSRSGTGTTFVIGIEDSPYFCWQTAIFLESFRGKLPSTWQTLVVVCNDGEPLSDELANILTRYETEWAVGINHGNSGTIGLGHKGRDGYPALNKVEALSVASAYVDDRDMICLLDSDVFLYGELNVDIMPKRCAAPRNWHIDQDLFFSSATKNCGKGVDLRKLLDAIGCKEELKPGAVNIFVTGETVKNGKFVADCFRFAQVLFLLGGIADLELVWIAELPCFALAMTVNRIPYDLLERKELLVSDCDERSIPPGTLYHYYSRPGPSGRAPFRGSKWYKHAYKYENFLRTDFRQFAADAETNHERYFFDLAERAAQRLY